MLSDGSERIADLKSALAEWINPKSKNQRRLITKPGYSIKKESTSEELSLHHIISYSHLVEFVKQSLIPENVEIFALLLRIIKDYAAYERVYSTLGGSSEMLNLFEQCIDERLNEINDPRNIIKIKKGQSVREAINIKFSQLFQKMLRLFVWPPYNLIEGPKCRTRDRGNAFDSEIVMLLDATAYFQMIDFRRTLWTINNLPEKRTAELYDHLYELHRDMLNSRPLPRAYNADEWTVDTGTQLERKLDQTFAEYEVEHELEHDLPDDADVDRHFRDRALSSIDELEEKMNRYINSIGRTVEPPRQSALDPEFCQSEAKLFRVHLTRRDFSYERLLTFHLILCWLMSGRFTRSEYLLHYLRQRTSIQISDFILLAGNAHREIHCILSEHFKRGLRDRNTGLSDNNDVNNDQDIEVTRLVKDFYAKYPASVNDVVNIIICRKLDASVTDDEELRIHQKNFLYPKDTISVSLVRKRVNLRLLRRNWLELTRKIGQVFRELSKDLKTEIRDGKMCIHSSDRKRVIDICNLYRVDHLMYFFKTFSGLIPSELEYRTTSLTRAEIKERILRVISLSFTLFVHLTSIFWTYTYMWISAKVKSAFERIFYRR